MLNSLVVPPSGTPWYSAGHITSMRPTRQSVNQVPAHWSKDFVEHLRTVHFALIAVAAGLILLVLSAREYNAVTALVLLSDRQYCLSA
jgi:hypothetical protein